MDKFQYIFDNGIAHIDAAQSLSEDRKYGFAISHLILSLEEFIKYVVLIETTENDTAFKPNEITSLFKSHTTKHEFLKEFQENISIKSFVKYIDYHLLTSSPNASNEEIESVTLKRFERMGNFLYAAYSESNFKDNEKQEFLIWLENAANLKNNGFYANNPLNQEKCPNDFTINDYNKALFFSEKIQQQITAYKKIYNFDSSWLDS